MVKVTYFLKQFLCDSSLTCDDCRIASCRDIVTAWVRLDEILGDLVPLISVSIIPDDGGAIALNSLDFSFGRVLGHHNVGGDTEHLTCKS